MSAEDNIVVATAISGEDQTLGNNPITCNTTNNASNTREINDERPSCKFGRQCFRQNPRHRLDMAHPGDIDFTVPNMPEPIDGASKCKYGRQCYRLNPEHFKNFQHPRNINIQENYRKYVLQRQGNRRNSDSSFDYNFSDDDGTQDPFGGDSGSDYKPSDDED
ncbi:aprataxin and PNK-like factor [Lucilia cuprina]|uniref:aprataxin and PNK-like factor n=1 Tax=Lucilia cuprina TaxID=7375 RepID=UPI001F06773A|nr:aprataxin and PNK-like factor [Lucilia cuprina]XP_046804420.1 aprataxin and PNK-like factor [Lucilia cuprina]XP_046804421.1 aprataxin and PNK-like factor [Lucilia cuprina]